MARRYRGLGAAVIILVLVAALAPGQSRSRPSGGARSASVAARRAAQRATLGVRTAPGRIARHATSRPRGGTTSVAYYNWAGYADDNSSGTTYLSVSGHWTQPTMTCPTHEYQVAVFWVGLDGFNNGTVEQDGTLAECYEGVAYYYTWWEMYPTNSITIVGNAKAGDAVTASVLYSSGKFHLRVTDVTTPAASLLETEACGAGLTCARASAEWIAETPSQARGYYPLPDFATWHLLSAHVTGGATRGVISSFPDDVIDLISIAPYNLATTSTLAPTGTSFTAVWDNSY
ncbi:MAG: G1 family glutamic endopeptidase [Jatrophihabitantaceae bacterium]